VFCPMFGYLSKNWWMTRTLASESCKGLESKPLDSFVDHCLNGHVSSRSVDNDLATWQLRIGL
jgi:hypothetical protein